MPVSCLHGVELPNPKKNKWSKPVTVSYTTEDATGRQSVSTMYQCMFTELWQLLNPA